MAQIQNIIFDQGSSFQFDFTITTSDGSVVDLAAYNVRSQMRKSYTSSTKYTITSSVVAPTTGTIRLQLTASQTRVIKSGRYVYDVEIYTTNNVEVIRVCEGLITVSPGVYRP